jgi:hypothetical protein
MSVRKDFFFFNIALRYSYRRFGTLQSRFTGTNLVKNEKLSFQNTSNSWLLNANFSKYLFFISSTVSVTPSYDITSNTLLENGILLPYKTKHTGLTVGLETKINQHLNASYSGNTIMSRSSSTSTNDTRFVQIQHRIAVNYLINSNLYIKLVTDHFETHQPAMSKLNYTFMDLSGKYIFSKRKVELEVQSLNLLNTQSYATTFLWGNVSSQSIYRIPGRMLQFRIIFNY